MNKFTGNNIENEGAKEIAEALKTNKSLTKLDLRRTTKHQQKVQV